MKKSCPNYYRYKKLHEVFYRHRGYLHNLDKISCVCSDLSYDNEDVAFKFNSRYGEAHVILCNDYVAYKGPTREFTSNEELDYYQENALKELELYIFRIYKPKKKTLKDYIKAIWRWFHDYRRYP